jgi:hypothetical protein
MSVEQDGYVSFKTKGKDREFTLTCGEFGWGPDTCESWDSKLSYVVTSIISHMNDTPEISDVENNRQYRLVKEVVADFTGLSVNLQKLQGYHPYGYIDHQSHDTLSDYLSEGKTDEDFKNDIGELIFNRKYTIVIDNDNH